MSAVTVQEIVEALRQADDCRVIPYFEPLADRIEAHGIAPPDVDANGCSTHPKARHGFARQASHSEGEYVCDCAGFDPYDAGYQDGIRAAWDGDGALLPDGMVLVPRKLTTEMLLARNNNSWPSLLSDEAEAIWDAFLAAAKVKP